MATSRSVVGKQKRALPTTAYQRLKQDYLRLLKDPVPFIVATPCMDNILEWHYLISGPPDSPYEGGYYHGKLKFPHEYPFKPPSIYIITPNGRFKCNQRLCLSISDFHPDTWNPAWSVSTILTGLLSFMLEDHATLGSVTTTVQVKRRLAMESLSYNLKDEQFCELFPEAVQTLRKELEKRQEAILRLDSNRSNKPGDSTSPQTDMSNMDTSMIKHLCVLCAVAAIGYGLKLVLNHANELDQ